MNLFNTGRALLIVLLCAAPLGLGAEDAPAPAPTPAPVAAPAPEAKPDPKAEATPVAPIAPAQADAAQQTTSAAPVAVGPKPTFPLQSKHFDEISDSYDEPYEAMNLERFSTQEILEALKNCKQEDLDQAVEASVTFKNLMLQPQNYRGHVLRFNGVFRAKDILKMPTELLEGAPQAWIGHISDGKLNIINFVSFEPLPQNMPVDNTGVTLSGVFLKRLAYKNNEAGEKAQWGPLLFIRKLQPYSELEQAQTPTDPTWKWIEIVFSILIAAALLLYGYTSMKTRAAGRKYFSPAAPKSVFPTSKGGGNRHFPRPK